MKEVKIAGIVGAIGVITGAFGAHALKTRLSIEALQSYKTAVLYLLLHTIVLLIIGLYLQSNISKVLRQTYYLILSGILLFSFSIFILSTQSLTGLHLPFLGPITPIGGLLMILGWLNLVRIK